MFRHNEKYLAQRRCLTHHLHETSLIPILSVRVPKTATSSWVQKGSGFKRSARGRVLPSSVIEVRAILPSPYCTELASLKLQRFRFLPAFSACCCSFSLSESGEPVFLEPPSNASRLHRRSHRACHGARSQYSYPCLFCGIGYHRRHGHNAVGVVSCPPRLQIGRAAVPIRAHAVSAAGSHRPHSSGVRRRSRSAGGTGASACALCRRR